MEKLVFLNAYLEEALITPVIVPLINVERLENVQDSLYVAWLKSPLREGLEAVFVIIPESHVERIGEYN